jgi:prevent-host-death family protein
MTAVKVVSSRDARQQWREMLDTVMSGSSDVAIMRYGKPVAVLIPAVDYEALSEELEQVRMTRLAEDIYEQYLADRKSAIPYDDVRSELLNRDR